MNTVLKLACVATVIVSSAANADLYVGGTLGASDYKDATNNPVALRAFVGQQYNENVALEASYFNLGKAEYQDVTAYNLTADGVAVDALAIWPLSSKFSLNLRSGVAYTQLKGDREKSNSLSLRVGAGADALITPKFNVGVEVVQQSVIGQLDDLTRYNVNTVEGGINAKYRF